MDTRLAILQTMAMQDEGIRAEFLATRTQKEPLVAFERLSVKYGQPVTVGELASLGEESCAAMLRSQNGGGEIEPMGWSDDYELFFLQLERR